MAQSSQSKKIKKVTSAKQKLCSKYEKHRKPDTVHFVLSRRILTTNYWCTWFLFNCFICLEKWQVYLRRVKFASFPYSVVTESHVHFVYLITPTTVQINESLHSEQRNLLSFTEKGHFSKLFFHIFLQRGLNKIQWPLRWYIEFEAIGNSITTKNAPQKQRLPHKFAIKTYFFFNAFGNKIQPQNVQFP